MGEAPAAGRVSSRTIIGREEPLRRLEGLLTSARDAVPGLMLLAGEAGVGKTRLVQALEPRARELGFLVLHGESVEFGGEQFPYAPLVAAMRDLPETWRGEALEELEEEAREELAALLPRARIARSATRESRFSSRYGQGRLCELVLDLLGRLAHERAPVREGAPPTRCSSASCRAPTSARPCAPRSTPGCWCATAKTGPSRCATGSWATWSTARSCRGSARSCTARSAARSPRSARRRPSSPTSGTARAPTGTRSPRRWRRA